MLGPTLTYLTPRDAADGEPCVLRGLIPPGGVVPLHSHADPETFLVAAGALDGLAVTPDGSTWIPVRASDVFHVPGDAQHAWRNPGTEPAVTTVVTTARMGRFFLEVAAADPASFLVTAER